MTEDLTGGSCKMDRGRVGRKVGEQPEQEKERHRGRE